MKFKLHAGAELNLLTREELAETLQSWGQELTRGAKHRRHSIAGTVDGTGALLMGGPADGPGEGFVWAVTRLSTEYPVTVGEIRVYVNAVSPSALVWSGLVTDASPGDHGLVLNSGEYLIITGSSLTANDQVTVTMQIKEAPTLTAWSL